TACAVGADSPLWAELADGLPRKTFELFAASAGYSKPSAIPTTSKPSWANLLSVFELEMDSRIRNKERGATKKTLSPSTKKRYMQSFAQFTAFLGQPTLLSDITESTIELYKVRRAKAISETPQSNGGASLDLDIAILHRIFAFAVSKKMQASNPINMSNESKPGASPKNGARPFDAEELIALRKHARQDMLMMLVLLQTGLRGSDAVSLKWQNVRFDIGINGEIQVMTLKRTKPATIPMVSELHDALIEVIQSRYSGKAPSDDYVLYNPDTKAPFMNGTRDVEAARKRMYARVVALGKRAGVDATPHDFRDTFACDALAKRVDIFSLAKMLADTVETIETHYASFIPAARDAAQNLLETGIGIEEQARIAKSRGKKVTAMRARAS
ncbi:MAG TPA: site-specific integrase, partial [Candidatus Acidoferrales bacterium]|nr:site-specific integrase [Candidatus Acidoferrales bacterium]